MSSNGKWRLKRTLARKLEFRPIEDEDVKYAWATYKKGGLASLGERFANGEMDAATFKAEFEAEIIARYHGAWTLFAETKHGFIPVGMVFAFHSHPDPKLSPFMIVGDIVWMPWASARNKIESGVNFFNKMRNEIPMIDYVGEKDKRYFEMIAKHGVMRRVGTTHSAFRRPIAVFETR